MSAQVSSRKLRAWSMVSMRPAAVDSSGMVSRSLAAVSGLTLRVALSMGPLYPTGGHWGQGVSWPAPVRSCLH